MAARRWIGWLLAGLLAYAIFLVALLPAGVAWEQVRAQGAVPVGVSANGLSGTIWSGAAQQFTLPGDVVLDEVTWRFEPAALLTGRLRWTLRSALFGGWAEGRVAVGPGGLSISGVHADILAEGASAPFLTWPVAVNGRLIVDLDHFSVDRQGRVRTARGVFGWLDAAAGMPEALPLGDLRADLEETNDGGLRVVVRDQGGPLFSEGTISITPEGAYQIQGQVGTRTDADARLVQGLEMMGRAGPDGRIPIRFSGSL